MTKKKSVPPRKPTRKIQPPDSKRGQTSHRPPSSGIGGGSKPKGGSSKKK